MQHPTNEQPTTDTESSTRAFRSGTELVDRWMRTRAETLGALSTMPTPTPRPSVHRMVRRALPQTV